MEFAYKGIFKNLDELKMELKKYVLCYNNKRVYGALNYMTSVEYRFKKYDQIIFVSKGVDKP